MYQRMLSDQTILIGACYKCPLGKCKENCSLEELKSETYKEAYNRIKELTAEEQHILANKCRKCMDGDH